MKRQIEKPDISVQILALKAGLITFVSMMLYFLFLKATNMIQFAELRAVNFLILLAAILISFRYYKYKTNRKLAYIRGLFFGFAVSIVCLIPFSLFMVVYLSKVNPDLLLQFKENAPMIGAHLTPLAAAGSMLVEGICAGVILTFFLMQYFQNNSTRA